MPPKPNLAKKQKMIEDKTFGLKNKNKSKNVQKYVQSLQQYVQPKPDHSKINAQKKKEEEKAREKELNELFKVAVKQPKVPVEEGTMEDWDLETLEKVVESKSNEYNKNKPTDIVCEYFLEAVEKKQYGWFWVRPNGGKDCHYRHALPPGYVLKSQMKALLEEESTKITIEEEVENQRVATTTPMTTELFMQWKKKKMEEREAGFAAQRAERAKNDRMSGRELFLSDASLFVDDAEACDEHLREEEPDAEQKINKDPADDVPSSSTRNTEGTSDHVDENDNDDNSDDDLDLDELNELEASL